MSKSEGTIFRISGPVVTAVGMEAGMYDVVRVGHEGLMGEVIELHGDKAVIQVYEDTSGIRPGEPVLNTKETLSVALGPGLLTQIYDGIQRPLATLEEVMGVFITRGVDADAFDLDKKWTFEPTVKAGDTVVSGQCIGEVQETETIRHKIMIPPGKGGVVKSIESGDFNVVETVCMLDDGTEIQMMQKWPVRTPRPYQQKYAPDTPLVTGMRILDFLFPLAKGGAAGIPGPFGSGKTVTQQSLAKYSDAQIVVYIGCGERGNEMTEVLDEFPHLIDPNTGKPLMNRTVMIANTSNMPVAAREVYTLESLLQNISEIWDTMLHSWQIQQVDGLKPCVKFHLGLKKCPEKKDILLTYQAELLNSMKEQDVYKHSMARMAQLQLSVRFPPLVETYQNL